MEKHLDSMFIFGCLILIGHDQWSFGRMTGSPLQTNSLEQHAQQLDECSVFVANVNKYCVSL